MFSTALLTFRSEMFPSGRRYHLTAICPRDTYGSHLGLTWWCDRRLPKVQGVMMSYDETKTSEIGIQSVTISYDWTAE